MSIKSWCTASLDKLIAGLRCSCLSNQRLQRRRRQQIHTLCTFNCDQRDMGQQRTTSTNYCASNADGNTSVTIDVSTQRSTQRAPQQRSEQFSSNNSTNNANNNSNRHENRDQQQRQRSAIPPIVQMQTRDALNVSDVRRTIRGLWITRSASFFACLLCLINFYTISRFSILAFYLKGTFLLQFIILSVGFGLSLLLFLMSIGQYLGSGFLDIWFISPAFKGIGAAFLFTYTTISIYTSVPIAWLFAYFRDSFLASKETPFKWAFCSLRYNTENCIKAVNLSRYEYVGWSVSAYFHSQAMVQQTTSKQIDNGRINLAFNVALIWTIVFIVLSRGLSNAGRVFIVISVLGYSLFLMVSIRFVSQFGAGIELLFETTGKPFLTDAMSWLFAAREAFLIWCAFGSVVLNVCSHNRSDHNLIRQLIALFVLVLCILITAALFFASSMQVIINHNLTYVFSSFEEESLSNFVRTTKVNATPAISLISGSDSFLGEHLFSISDVNSRASHYNVMRFATEVFPAAVALEGPKVISSFWVMAFYLSAILTNVGSLLVIWGSVVDAIVSIYPKVFRVWRSIVALLSCFVAFLFSLPLTSTIGISIIYYLDFAFGSLWWLSLLFLLQIITVLIIRGRPCGAENLVALLASSEMTRNWLLPTLTFHWNLVVPVIIMVLSIAFTRSYNVTGLTWTQLVAIYPYWSTWSQYLSIFVQILPLLIVFAFGALQALLYLYPSNGESTHQRLQALFCPIIATNNATSMLSSDTATQGVINESFIDEPPPKYTPPPSYSTATARTMLKEFRHRFASSITIDVQFLGNNSSETESKRSACIEESNHENCAKQ